MWHVLFSENLLCLQFQFKVKAVNFRSQGVRINISRNRENEFDEGLEDTTEEAMSNCSRIKYRIVEHLFQQTYENGSRKGKTVYV